MAEQPIGERIKDSISGLGGNITNAVGSANENIQNAVTNAGASVTAAKDSFNNSMSDFSSKTAVAVNDSSFLDSNSMIAKFGFLILVVVMFIFLLQVGMAIIGYFINNPNPVLVPGQIIGTVAQAPITQNPSLATSLQILWSNNQTTGLEYTWSVWLQYTPGASPTTNTATPPVTTYTLQPVFIKGDCTKADVTPVTTSVPPTATNLPILSMNHGPGLFFYNDGASAHLFLVVDTVNSTIPQVIDISNIPINKYFHLAIRCQNIYMDMYINGSIVQRTQLINVPRQNFYNVFVCPAGGFNGYLSTLQYYSRALSVIDINAIASGKPDTRMLSNSSVNISQSNYLSTSWYNSFIN
jgi:hypothetical protein